MKRLFLVTSLFASLTLAQAAAPGVPGFTHVRTVGGIEEYRLESNHLRVLMLPQKGAPVATFMVTYHVGSRNEVTGTTGATHLLEHLMFKGTTKFDRELGTSYDQILERVGAMINATTWLDRTNYFGSVPTSALPLLIELEADRMRNLALREADRRPEMTVVRNEFERGENSPMEALEKELWSSAFMAHPYHHDTIGWRSDIENVPIEKLRAFYDTFYWPDNATATVIGEFDPVATLNAIKDKFGSIPKAPHPIPQLYTAEPEQTGQRRVLVKRGGELGVVALAHKIPASTHPDYAAIQVMSNVLTNGKTSRCYRELTDKGLTTEVSAWPSFTHDPSLHFLYAMLTSESKHADVERVLVSVIEKLKSEGATKSEVETAIGSLLANRAFARDGSFAQASELNECIAVGDWTLFTNLDSKIKSVTPADVQRVARKYLVENHSVAGWFVPSANSEGSEEEAQPLKEEHFEPRKTLPPKPLDHELAPLPSTDFAKRVVRKTIANIDTLVCRTSVKDIVSIQGSLRAGEASDRNRALAHLAAGMIERGTKMHDQFAIADMLDKVGAEIEFKVGGDMLNFTAKCLARDVPLVISLIAEELSEPRFDKEEFAKEQTQLASSLQMTLEDTDAQAALAFSQAVYPEGHPARKSGTKELIEAVRKASLEDVKAFHDAHYGPRDMHLVVVGDVDAAAFHADVHKSFDGWRSQSAKQIILPASGERKNVDIFLPDKTSVSIAMGWPSVQANDPDWLPLRVATDVLGNGFTSRLVANVRDREGLTYHIRSNLIDDVLRPGALQVFATFAPSLLDKGITSTHRQLEQWWQRGITADELDFAKSNGTGEFAVGLETTHGLAQAVMLCVLRGFDIAWLDQYPAKLQAVTLDQVNSAIQRHFDPKKMVTAKAGTLK